MILRNGSPCLYLCLVLTLLSQFHTSCWAVSLRGNILIPADHSSQQWRNEARMHMSSLCGCSSKDDDNLGDPFDDHDASVGSGVIDVGTSSGIGVDLD
jgi:hypothetical protein